MQSEHHVDLADGPWVDKLIGFLQKLIERALPLVRHMVLKSVQKYIIKVWLKISHCTIAFILGEGYIGDWHVMITPIY